MTLIPFPVATCQPELVDKFGARLRYAMEKRGWDQETLAEKSGLTPSAVSRHMERERAPRMDSVEKYCGALDVSVEWLAYGRGTYEKVDAATIAPASAVRVGRDALETVLRDHKWPEELTADDADLIVAAVRVEAVTSPLRPESVWRHRLAELARERLSRTKSGSMRATTPPSAGSPAHTRKKA